jgi:hypothetical protein
MRDYLVGWRVAGDRPARMLAEAGKAVNEKAANYGEDGCQVLQ